MREKKSVSDRIENYHIRKITNSTFNVAKDTDDYINANEKWNVWRGIVSPYKSVDYDVEMETIRIELEVNVESK